MVVKQKQAKRVPAARARRPKTLFRLIRDRSGAAAILTALAMPIVVGFAGLAVEVGLWHSQKRVLQTAADVGVMAAAEIQYMGGDSAAMLSAAQTDIAANGITVSGSGNTVATVTVNYPPKSGSYAGNTKAVEVVLQQPQNLLLSRYFLKNTLKNNNGQQTIAVRAVAMTTSLPGGACLLSLEPATAGILDSGTPNLTLKKCGAASNSSDSSSSMTDKGSAKVTADYVHLSGQCSTCVIGSNLVTSNYVQNGARTGDPYRTMSTPSTSGASQSDPKVKNNDNVTLQPGTYSSGISMTGGTATFSSGVYVITGSSSSLKITGGTATGSNVTFVIANGASVDMSGNPNVTFSAPTTGSYAGMLFYGSTASTSNNGIKFTGTSGLGLNGALYFPKSQVQYSGTTSAGSTCTNIVGLTVNLVGNATSTIDCTNSPYKPSAPDSYPYLVE